MTLKIFISDYTHRTEAEQLKTLHGKPGLVDAPIYRQDDLSAMFRPTTRQDSYTLFAASVACFAPTKDKFVTFLAECRKRKISIIGVEEWMEWEPHEPTTGIINAWRIARIDGAATVGGQRNAARWKSLNKDAIEKAKPLWGMPSKQYSIKDIEEITGLSRGAIVKVLGNRVPYQINHQAAQKRKERRNAKRDN